MPNCRECLHDEMCFSTHTGDSPACCDFLDADRYHEIMQAEREGRLVILPCKVGDVLYITEPRFYNYEKHEGVQTGVCKGYEMSPIHGWVIMAALEHGEPDTLYFYAFKDFGKTVFLTRSEAEKSLEEAKC